MRKEKAMKKFYYISSIIFCLFIIILTINCGGGNDAPVIVPPQTDFRTFITAVNPNGDLVGAGGLTTAIASADKLCNNDSSKPNTSTYRPCWWTV